MVAAPEIEALKPVLARLPLAVMVTDRSGVVQWTNDSFRELTGFTDEDLGQQDAGWLSQPGGATGTDILESLHAGADWQGGVVWSCPALGLCPMWLTVTPVRNAAGEVTYATWSAIKNHRPSTEDRLSSIFSSMAEGVVVQDAEGHILECNTSAERILGISAEQMAGLTSMDDSWAAIHEDGSVFSGENHPAMVSLRTGEPISNVVMGVSKADGITWISINARPLAHTGQKPYAVVTTFTDITERRNLEKRALENSEGRFRVLLEQAPDCVFLHDISGRIIDANKPACQTLGYTREELLATPIQKIAPRAAQGSEQGWWQRILAGESMRFEAQHYHKDGHLLPVEVSLGAVHLESGPAVLVIARDISERERAEATLREQVNFTQRIFNSTDSHLAVVGPGGEILAVNDAWRRFGRDNAAGDESCWGVGANYFAVCGPGAADSVLHGILDVQQGRIPEFETEYPCDTARDERWYNLKVLPLLGSPGTVLISHTNVTARRHAEDALRISEERHRSILHTALDGFCVTDGAGRLLEVNESYCRMSGYTAEELLGNNSSIREPAGDLAAHAEQIRAEGAGRFETRNRRKDGHLIDVEVSAQYQAAEGGRIIAFVRDITERKKAEADRAKLETRFRQAQKMESVGRLAGGIAHDFNNLLTVINGYSSLILENMQRTNPLFADIEEINRAGELAASLTRQLLAFSRKQVIQPVQMDLNKLIRKTVPMLQRMVGEDMIIAAELDDLSTEILADPDQIHQVLMNLAVNARDAMPEGGRLEIATSCRTLDEAEAAALDLAAVPGEYVLLTVTDTGGGMDEATRMQIFEPFFTTKEPGKGTGLGLAMVYGIIRQSQGWIDVWSERGNGTSIRIYLPRARNVSSAVKDSHIPETRQGAETILVVEDQDAVRSYTRAVLESCGYRVLEAGSGEKALALAASFSGQIHLTLADVVLPGINGKVMAEQLATMRPGMKVIFVSGYTWELINQRGILDQGMTFLQKPFTPRMLSAKVRQVLDEPAA